MRLAKWGAVVTLGPEENERRKRFIGTQTAFGFRKGLLLGDMILGQVTPPTHNNSAVRKLGEQPPDLVLSFFLIACQLSPLAQPTRNPQGPGRSAQDMQVSLPEPRAQWRPANQENTQHNMQPLLLPWEQKESHGRMIV